ncbi:hypothetical protein BDV97DRAFT_358963 [Delphinella strobiligena]|nr:hypothetical protein BDV97DRAFT_358963 [Delphinella strobiligena]
MAANTSRNASATSDVSTVSSKQSTSSTSTLRDTLPIHAQPESTPATSVSSESESDSDESSESSDEESDSDSNGSAEVDYETLLADVLNGTSRPPMPSGAGGDLKSRLAAFLPQLAQSNQELEELKARGELKSFEDVEEGKEYIEMDLGLGVLEEKKPGVEEDKDDEDEEMDQDEEEKRKKEEDVLGKLMGFKKGRQNTGISEVEGP